MFPGLAAMGFGKTGIIRFVEIPTGFL